MTEGKRTIAVGFGLKCSVCERIFQLKSVDIVVSKEQRDALVSTLNQLDIAYEGSVHVCAECANMEPQ